MKGLKRVSFKQYLSLVNNIFLLFLFCVFLSVPILTQAKEKCKEAGINSDLLVPGGKKKDCPLDEDTVVEPVADEPGDVAEGGEAHGSGNGAEPGGGGGEDDGSETADGDGGGNCQGAFDHAMNTVCHESSWSHIAKAMAAFSASQTSGDIKGACDAAKTLNDASGAVNTEYMASCGGALGVCVSHCTADQTTKQAELKQAQAAQARAAALPGPPDLTVQTRIDQLTAEIKDITSKIKTCSNKSKSTKVRGTAQVFQNAQAFIASDKCSKDASEGSQTANAAACSDFPPSLQAICLQNGPKETCNLYPGLPICQRLKDGEGDTADNTDPFDLGEGLEDDLAFTACLENPLSASCQSSFCSGLPTAPMRDVCNTDGVSAFCENLPSLPQCEGLAAAASGGGNCNGLSTQNLIEECQTSGRDSFCERHSQLTFCKASEGIGSDSELSELAQGDDIGPDGSGVGGGGGSGAGAGGFGGRGGNGFDSSSDSIGGEGADGQLTAEELQALRENGIDVGGPSARGGGLGRKRSRFKPEKFNPFDIKGLLGKKKKNTANRGISSVNSSLEITSANGLTNFQKVSRAMKARYPIFFRNQVRQARKTF